MLDMKALAQATAEIVQEHVQKATAPLIKRIADLETRPPVAGERGMDGTSITIDDVAPMIAQAVERAVAALPPAAPGEPGRDGVDGKDGADGRDGEPGAAGADGKDGANGADGRNGDDGKDGAAGGDGVDGRDGAPGVGVRGAIRAHDGSLHLTLSDGSTLDCGIVTGRDGRDGQDGSPGKAGRDGLQVKDIDLTLAADGRTLVVSLDDGEVSYTAEVGVPTMIYRGVFVEDSAYEKGDTVTWGGSLWHCNGETKDKPGEGSALWTLAVKKGRDAKPVSVA